MTSPEANDIGDEDRVLRHIGSTLLALQRMENSLRRCLYHISERPATTEVLEKLIKQDKKTLGMFIHHLKSRIEVFPAFEDLLKTLLGQRNLFVHRLESEDWFDLSTMEGRQEIRRFLLSVQKDCLEVNKLLGGFLLADAVAHGVDVSTVTEDPDYLSRMHNFLPVVRFGEAISDADA